MAGKIMKARFEAMKEITLLDPVVTIKTTRKETDQEKWDALKKAITE